ncbi:MAG: glycoside hydrolase family 172 protein [Cyclobacteriaceae bacterium]
MSRNLIVLLCLLFATAAEAQRKTMKQAPVISLATELQTFLDPGLLPMYRDQTSLWQTSSYDRTGGNDDGFSGRYSFLRRNADSSLVIFEAKGPGVINRIWTPTPGNDTLDFYIDSERPTFSICYKDLFTGKVSPFVLPLCGNQLGGFYCYLPIPFQRSCRIVYRGKRTQFHQIQYRQLPASTHVEPFRLPLPPAAQAAMRELATRWDRATHTVADLYPGKDIHTQEVTITLHPHEVASLFTLSAPGRLLGFEIDAGDGFEGLHKPVDLTIETDGEEIPAVRAPASDFFGYAFGSPSMQSLLLGRIGTTHYSYWPMPFDKQLTLLLEGNRLDKAITVKARLYSSSEPRNTLTEGKFYAQWNAAPTTTRGQSHTLLDIQAKGHFVGTILQARGKKAGMTYFFEGDDSTVVDGVMNIHGTGSEDYFNGGWYALADRWDRKMSLPMHGALEYSLPWCRTGGYRFYLSDKIPFQSRFYHAIEHGPVKNETPADYTSLSFYYADRGPASQSTVADSDVTVAVPDTLFLYPQLMDMTVGENAIIKAEWKYPTGGQTYNFAVTEETSIRISLRELPLSNYEVLIDYNQLPDGCSFSLWQRQTQVSGWLNANASKESRQEHISLGTLRTTELLNTLTFRFQTTATRRQWSLNRLIFIRRKD